MPKSKPNKPTFRDLKASFETRDQPIIVTTPPIPPRRHSLATSPANMPSENKPNTRTVPALAHSIDSVLSTSPAKQPQVRPVAKLRPYWIGPPPPDRPRTPGPAMKQYVNIEYSSPGLQPPVYIFTSLSSPQWEAVEMQTRQDEEGDFVFSKAFDVEEGEYQYKFRLGPGDWWVCDESRRTVDDGMGNKNNLLVVKAPEVPRSHHGVELNEAKVATVVKPRAINLPDHAPMTPAPSESAAPTPMPKVEAFFQNKGSASQQTPYPEVPDPFMDQSSPDDVDAFVSNTKEDSESSSSSDSEDENTQSPLLRHESVHLHSHEQENAPLFRHESIALGYNHHEPEAEMMESHTSVPQHASAPHVHWNSENKNPNLEHFPTDQAGILEKIHRASISFQEEELDDSPESQVLSETPISPISLPSVEEADEELTHIREAEEVEYEKEEESGEEMDPLREVETEPEDEGFEPKVQSEEILIEQTIVVEVIEQRRQSVIDTAVEKVGGRKNAIAIGVSMMVAVVSVVAVRLM